MNLYDLPNDVLRMVFGAAGGDSCAAAAHTCKALRSIALEKAVKKVHLCNTAAVAGHLNILRWGSKIGCTINVETVICAACSGNIPILKWLQEYGCQADRSVFTHAVSIPDNIETLEWMLQNGEYPFKFRDMIVSAASAGAVSSLDWINCNCLSVDSSFTICARYACISGHICVLEWLRLQRINYLENYLTLIATKHNHADVVQYLFKIGCDINPSVYAYAAKNGNLELMSWFHENNVPLWGYIYYRAAKHGHIHVIEWALANGVPMYSGQTGRAAHKGLLDALKILHKYGVQFDDDVFMSGISSNDLSVVRWLHENGCPRDESVFKSATNASVEILDYLYENGYPYDDYVGKFAAGNGILKTLQWIHSKNLLQPEVVREYARRRGQTHILDWLRTIK